MASHYYESYTQRAHLFVRETFTCTEPALTSFVTRTRGAHFQRKPVTTERQEIASTERCGDAERFDAEANDTQVTTMANGAFTFTLRSLAR